MIGGGGATAEKMCFQKKMVRLRLLPRKISFQDDRYIFLTSAMKAIWELGHQLGSMTLRDQMFQELSKIKKINQVLHFLLIDLWI